MSVSELFRNSDYLQSGAITISKVVVELAIQGFSKEEVYKAVDTLLGKVKEGLDSKGEENG